MCGARAVLSYGSAGRENAMAKVVMLSATRVNRPLLARRLALSSFSLGSVSRRGRAKQPLDEIFRIRRELAEHDSHPRGILVDADDFADALDALHVVHDDG